MFKVDAASRRVAKLNAAGRRVYIRVVSHE